MATCIDIVGPRALSINVFGKNGRQGKKLSQQAFLVRHYMLTGRYSEPC